MGTATKHSAGGLVPDTAEGSRMMDTPGYEKLADVLRRAYEQAAQGKGAERHASGKPFHEQPMQDLIKLYGAVIALEAQVTQ